jgi:enterochelin esterase family protein
MFIYGFNEFKRIKKSGVYVTEMEHIYDGALIAPNAPVSQFTQVSKTNNKGTLQHVSIQSDSFSQARRITVYTPPEYNNSVSHKLLVVFDAYSYVAEANQDDKWKSWVPTPTILDNLITQGFIPPTVAVFIWNHNDRNQGLISDAMADFVSKDLMHWLNNLRSV